MKTRPVLPLLTSSLLLFSGGCGFFQGDQNANTPEPPPPDQKTEAPPPAVPLNKATPLPQVDMAALGLVPPVTPKQRLSKVERGRNNPFALIPIVAKVPGSGPTGDGTTGDGAMGDGTTGGGKGTQGGGKGTQGGGKIAKAPFYPVGKYCKFEGATGGGIIEIQPEEAKGVFVSGIMTLPTATYAIITPKNGKVAQSVRQGSYFGNGVVKVASIDPVNETVIFEENGKFVYREVGQRPEATKTDAQEIGENFPFKIQPPKGKQAYGAIVRGNKALMLTQASVVLVNVAGEDRPGTQKQVANQPTPTPSTPPENQPTPATPQGTGGPNVAGQSAAPQKSISLMGTICNDSSQRLSVSRIKIQIQDPETNTILDTQWANIANTNVVLSSGQQAKFEFPIPRLQDSASGTISVKLIDWHGG